MTYRWAITEVFGIPPWEQLERFTRADLLSAAAYIDRRNSPDDEDGS